MQNSLLQKEKKARVSIECHLNKILGWPKSSFGFFQLWIGWRLELGEVGFWGGNQSIAWAGENGAGVSTSWS